MAVSNQKFAKDFWPGLRRLVLVMSIVVQIVGLAITSTILFLFEVFELNLIASIALLATQLTIGAVVSILLFGILSQPIKDILAVIVHVAGDRTATPPPNPNEISYQKNGFKDVLQTLYNLASSRPVAADNQTTTPTDIPTSDTSESVQAALDKTLCGFVVMDQSRLITYANKAAPISIDRDGLSRLSLVFNGQDTLDNWLAECEKSAVRAERTWTRIPDRLPDQEDRRFFDVIASYDKGSASEVVITLIDRTSVYMTSEEDLDFIAFAAHELRGPITVIRGYLDVLEDELADVLKDDHQELFRRLAVSSNRLSGYINNILNTSRYDRRHLKIHLTETTVNRIYDTIRDDMQLRASSQNRILTVTIPDGLPTIAADPASMAEVLSNLIDNAIKYSSEGGAINVTASVKGDLVEIAVQDHGIGMPANVMSNLFQKFYRSHRSSETVAGTGIGLYISKAIVESNGGTIGVQSEEGRGSTFTVSLPTFRSVADKLQAGNNSNENFIDHGEGWIKNHSMYRG